MTKKMTFRKIMKENIVFFLGFLFVFVGGISILFFIDKGDAILFVNGYRNNFFDIIFRIITKFAEVYIYLVLIIGFLFYKVRYSIIISIVGFVNLITSFGLKRLFHQDRPYVFFKKLGIDDRITYIKGVNNHILDSFPSGHTLSAFALFGLLAFLFFKNRISGLMFLIFAALIGFSRIYLIQHFLQDVLFGGILGIMIAIFVYYFYENNRIFSKDYMDKNIIKIFQS